MTRAFVALLALSLLAVPAAAPAADVVDTERLVASPSGAFYAILQQDGELELVRRAAGAPPMRSRLGDKRPDEQSIRMGATAQELSRAAGLTHGIEADRGDAIIASLTLRDRLESLHVFDDGSGFVARYASSPSRYDDLTPIRHPDGTDVGLVAVQRKPMGELRRDGHFVHLYTRKDALFWGDPGRGLVLMVSGAQGVAVTPKEGAHLVGRDGREPELLAWSYKQEEVVDAPFEALLDRIGCPSPEDGLAALFLARALNGEATAARLKALARDRSVPHPVRLHAAATLQSEGDRSASAVILASALGLDGPAPQESPFPQGSALALRRWAMRLLPLTHPHRALGDLLRLAADPTPAVAEAAVAALQEGPWGPDAPAQVALLTLDRTQASATRVAGMRWLIRADPRYSAFVADLADDPDPLVAAAAAP